MYKWADPTTKRGQVEAILEKIIGGGPSDEDIREVVDTILALIERD